MNSQDAESFASRYLQAAGQSSDERYQLDIAQFAWLVDHCTNLGEVRLELLQALQSSLSGPGEPDVVAESKELLTNLIIMETRVSDRNERLYELLKQLAGSRTPDRVTVDQVALTEAIQAITDASKHLLRVGPPGPGEVSSRKLPAPR